MLNKRHRCTPVGSGFSEIAGRAKAKVRDPGTIKMVEAAYVKLNDYLWYLSERFVPVALFSASVADCDKKEMANAIIKYQSQARPDCQRMPETEDLGAKRFKHFVGPDSLTCFKLLHGKNPAFLTKRVQKWSTEESY